MKFRALLLFAISLSIALPIAAHDALAASKKKTTKITVRKHAWKGYGFLPGYPPAERRRGRDMTDRRFIGWDGQVYYGFGQPGFYRGQYNGGSMGPCWTSTPIGFIYNCGG